MTVVNRDIVLATDMAELDTLDPQARDLAMVGMLEQALGWLASPGSARETANLRAYVATAADAGRRLKVSKGVQVDAEIMVRRYERALGKAIRDGQEHGEIGCNRTLHSEHVPGVRGSVSKNSCLEVFDIPSPKSFFGTGSQTGHQIYAMTDDVTDEDFEAALGEAKVEGNMSRANLVRKIKVKVSRKIKVIVTEPNVEETEVDESTYRQRQAAKWDRIAELAASGSTSLQIAHEVGMGTQGVKNGAKQRGIDIRADRVVGRVHRLDSNRIMRESVNALENTVNGLALVNYDDVDPREAQTWVDSLTTSISALSKANRQIKESLHEFQHYPEGGQGSSPAMDTAQRDSCVTSRTA